ncbi:glyoxalase superfamily protein [Devosia sp. XJ19-1]|uniref:Glyoxalase superfamily protein n=1 Tax=Devosia ureilytica TaxID=2952754 RepID=A0A9Q4AL14_9HYPH|nr:glyoxalase superfamily protein [Devosia ureilytica]MCP8882557.1 glyoxalase superfamily protein [Devosia ureilytica]MCP8885556.1 glyoxalase superfamily protein [Devosia ureilytica]
MSYSLDTPSAQTLKSEAKHLRESRASSGQPMTHSEALEHIARAHGFRDWNTARAALPDRVAVPFQVGMRVKGFYLEQPFTGLLIGVQLLGNMHSFTVTVQFDEPVNVTPTFMFAALRHRVVSTVDIHGVSPALRGNGQPQMRLMRA